MLDDYIDHLKETDNKSLLARIYGIFRVKTPYFAKLEVIVMQNTSNFVNPKKMKYQFDLKGSMVNRKVAYDDKKVFKYLNEQKCNNLQTQNTIEVLRSTTNYYETIR